MFQKIKISNFFQIMAILAIISLSLVACGAPESPAKITGSVWQWVQLVDNDSASPLQEPTSASYTIQFSEDGTVSIKADCNMVGGSYTIDGANLTIALGPSTMAYCGEQSLDWLFTASLANVAGFTVDGNYLNLQLADNADSLEFIGE